MREIRASPAALDPRPLADRFISLLGDAGRLDGPDLLLHLRVPEVVEAASTVAEHHRMTSSSRPRTSASLLAV